MKKRCLFISLLGALMLTIPVSFANPFAAVKKASSHSVEAVGSYANGCIFGAKALPKSGNGYQIMRQSRNRYYGHTDLIDYIERLSALRAQKGELLLIGDLSQPRGGRMPSDHASHQMGLDVDIWLSDITPREFKSSYIENLTMRSVVDRGKGTINQHWRDQYFSLIADAASDPIVDRIFVNSVIKKKLCDIDSTASWQYKVRPWFGHDSHFHVRLKCPKNDADCITQAPIPHITGCNSDLNNWINDQIQVTLYPKKARKGGSVTPKPPQKIPQRCLQLVQ